jgi:hypothetical protein
MVMLVDDLAGADPRVSARLMRRGLVYGCTDGSRLLASSWEKAEELARLYGLEVDGQIIEEVENE